MSIGFRGTSNTCIIDLSDEYDAHIYCNRDYPDIIYVVDDNENETYFTREQVKSLIDALEAVLLVTKEN